MADMNGEMNTQTPAVSMKPPSSIISTTKTAVEQAVESTSAGNGSILVFQGNSKCHEAEVHSSYGPDYTCSTSSKSEISQNDSQHKMESSCSNYGGPTGDQHASAIGKILLHSSNSENLNCSSEKEVNIRSCNGHTTSHSAERTISSEISGESENISKLGPEIINKAKSDSSKEQNTFVARFDLNEDINEDDYIVQPVAQTLSSHSVIHVMAKAAVPRGIPMKPLKFEGSLGWKASAETSAFRPTILNCARNSKSSMEFDLNVTAVEDCASNGFLDSSREVGPRKTEGFGFDLNCLYDATDEFPKPSPLESRIPPLMDLNLNSVSEIPVKIEAYSHAQEFFMPVPNSIQQLEFMQRVSPFQPMLQYTSHALPPRSYMSKAPFHFSAPDSLPSTIHYSKAMPPHLEHPKENGIFMNPRMVHSVAPPYFVQVAHGHSNSAVSTPKVEDYLSRSGSKMDDARQLFRCANNCQTGEEVKSLQHEAWYATSAKRKEPEGGLEYYQLGYRC